MKLAFWRREERSLENPSVSLSDPRAWFMAFGGGVGSAAGVNVTKDVALGVPAVWAAVNFLADTIASLPLQVFRKVESEREKVENDPLYGILHDAPNDEWSSFRWRKYSVVNSLTHGRSFTFIERNRAGRVMNLWPLNPMGVTIERRQRRTFYRYKQDQQPEVVYQANEIIDIPFLLREDGLAHYSPIETLKDTIGLAVALEGYASRFFQNGGVPPLALQGPITSVAAAKRASEDIMRGVKDAQQEGRNVLVLPAGHELKPVGLDPEKSQMVEAQRFIIEQVARIYGLPPVFLQDLTHGTFSNTEQQDLNLTKHRINHEVKAWEQEMNLKLFSPRNRRSFVEFNVDGLLRGDFATRMTGYATAIQNAIRTPDEVRALENLPPQAGAAGKLHIQGATVPLGTQPALQPEPEPEPEPQPEDDDDDAA